MEDYFSNGKMKKKHIHK